MKIQKQDMYHGAALTQVVESPAFKALNKAADGKYGHYVLNNDTRLFVKYTAGSGPEYRFNLSGDDVKAIAADEAGGHKVFLVLVCGEDTVCAVGSDEVWELVDRTSTGLQQVWVDAPAGKSMRFGKGGTQLARAIPHNSFPAVVLD